MVIQQQKEAEAKNGGRSRPTK